MSSILRIQIELPVDVVNRVNSYLHSMLGRESPDIQYSPASEWRLPIATIRDFSEEAVLAIRDYARAACAGMHPIGLSFTSMAFDKSGNATLPVQGSVSDISECATRLERRFKERTGFNISVNHNPSLIVGHMEGEHEAGVMDFRRPLSWTADSICLTRPGPSGIEHRLFVLYFNGGSDAAVYG